MTAVGNHLARWGWGTPAEDALLFRPVGALALFDGGNPALKCWAIVGIQAFRLLQTFQPFNVSLMEPIAEDGYGMQTLIAEIVARCPFVKHCVQESVASLSHE